MHKMYLTLVVTAVLNFVLSSCASNLSVVSEARPEDVQAGVQTHKFKWPHAKPLSAKEEEEFNTNYTSLEGTFKSLKSGEGATGPECRIYLNENDISFVISNKAYLQLDKEQFEKKTKTGTPVKFLVEHLEAEQPHADPKTGGLSMQVYGVIVGNDNIDMIKSN